MAQACKRSSSATLVCFGQQRSSAAGIFPLPHRIRTSRLAVAPRDSSRSVWLFCCLCTVVQTEESIHYHKKALAVEPNNDNTHMLLGYLYETSGMYVLRPSWPGWLPNHEQGKIINN
jgi:hypothetical protein